MEQGGLPPISGEAGDAEPKRVSRGRWWFHLCVLAIFPLVPGVMGIYRNSDKPILPKTVFGLVAVSAFEVGFFCVFLGIAWLASRVTAEQMLLRWRRGPLPIVLGLAYSIGLRIAVLIVVGILALAWELLTHARPQDLQQFRPQVENLMDVKAILNNPLYFALCLTLISFVVGGLREELWRAAMFAGIKELFPAQFEQWRGKIVGIVIVALLFGLGHTAQGMVGVLMTGVLGVGLGVVMLFHRSIWEAAIAHGFFDATTFASLFVIVKYFHEYLPGLGQ